MLGRLRIILVIGVVAIGIVIIAIGVSHVFTNKQMTATIENILISVANTADRLLSSEISLLNANVAASAWYLRTAEAEHFHQTLEEQIALYPWLLALTVVRGPAAGETWDSACIEDTAGSVPLPEDLINSEYVRRAFTGEPIISTTRIQPESGALVQHICVSLDKSRVLVATINGMYFSNMLKGITIWETGNIYVLDEHGVFLAHSLLYFVSDRYNFIEKARTDPQYENAAKVMNRMIRGETGIGRYSIEGMERICVFRPISASAAGWNLGIVAPINEGPFTGIRNGIVMVGIVAVILNILAAVLVAGFIDRPYRTIREMVKAMEYQETLLHTTNQIAEILLRSDSSRFNNDLHTCMGMISRSVDVDRMRIFQNIQKGDELFGILRYEWQQYAPDAELSMMEIDWRDAPNWYKNLSEGRCVNTLMRNIEGQEQDLLLRWQLISLLLVPLFLRGEFWGFASFADMQKERSFTFDEEGIMSAGTSLVMNARERIDIENDLIRAREEALISVEGKSHFLANMSHEMRTPLNAIIGLSELSMNLCKNNCAEKEELNSNIEKIHDAGETLLGTVNDILDLSKIESGKFEIVPADYDLPSLINDIITLNSMRIGSKPITFHLHIDENLPAVLKGDELRIKQLMNNLLSNAFKYTKEGRVDWTLSCQREGDTVRFSAAIKDTGIGIRSEDVQKLFSDYNQVDTKSNRKIEGTGLGLSITKKMAELMEGSISVESEYGVGSTFTLVVKQGFVNDRTIGKDVAESLIKFTFSDAKRRHQAKLTRIPVPNARVLVVDDVNINLTVAAGLLKPYKMKVDCVRSGPEAIALVKETKVKYNAIFMDHMMPEMDGIEATRIIREEIGTDYAKTVPIIALTANAIVGNEEMFLSSGFQAFISKPIDIRALDSVINHWIRDKLEENLPAL